MNNLHDRLIAMIDEILAQLVAAQDTPHNSLRPNLSNIIDNAVTDAEANVAPPRTPSLVGTALDGDQRRVSKRHRQNSGFSRMELTSSGIDKLIEGILEQIYNPKSLITGDELQETMQWMLEKVSGQAPHHAKTRAGFSDATNCCRQIATSDRTSRSFEVVMQAY